MNVIWKAWKVLSNILVTVVVILAVVLLGLRIMGFRAYTVLSGSMEPEIPTGALIYVRSVDPKGLEVGDVITFMLNEDTAATHRIAEILEDEDQLHFITKGDANEVTDAAPVHSKNVVGTPVLVIPAAGYLVRHIQTPPGTYIAISLGAVLMLVLILPELLREGSSTKQVGKYLQR